MAHPQQIKFCKSIKNRFPASFTSALVLDIGSLDINGNNQYLFSECLYLGVDVASGKNVDFTCKGHELNLPDQSLDTIISSECFEHDQFYEQTINNIIRLLKPGGMFIFTCATTGRPEHGTRRTSPQDAPLLQNMADWGDYYKNLTERDIREILDVDATFSEYEFSVDNTAHDLYFWGVKKGHLQKRGDYSFQIEDSQNQRTIQDLLQKNAALEQTYSEKFAVLEHSLSEKIGQIAVLEHSLSEKIERLGVLTQEQSQLNEHIRSSEQIIFDQNHEISLQKERIAYTVNDLETMLSSNSWLITSPIRAFRRKATLPYLVLRRIISFIANWCWVHAPVSNQNKQKLKSVLFSNMPILFSWSQTYRRWISVNAPVQLIDTIPLAPHEITWSESIECYVPLLLENNLQNKSAKIICFYLPQFHPIPENDNWWGTGFTEWTNVKPAQPQFVGHYQPHIPDELGYYSLLDSTTQRRQVELAKLYGIEGFCFYFYWFGGKRLLETPIENYLKDCSLDLPFCLCWANENWSRRWDGLDGEILIGQQYSEKDDLAFIEEIARHMRDSRYIRINSKPLLIVYRPNLLPSAKNSAQRWRTWCRENGIGEIYIAYTQSFEAVDPAKYGFDAAIEFPPNNSSPPVITDTIKPLRTEFGGTIYDWSALADRSKKYQKQSYTLFRGVCPSWDNTPRRKNKGTIFLNSSPSMYQQWLTNAIRDTQMTHTTEDEQLVFVNAWNEWAEGAHLEPDQKYGYAFLEATRLALVKTSSSNIIAINSKNRAALAIIIHAYYFDIFLELLEKIEELEDSSFKLFVTAPESIINEISDLLKLKCWDHFLLVVDNKGRDVLPFLKVARIARDEGYDTFLKLHTKKSTHRNDGDIWRDDIYQKLIAPQSVKNAMLLLQSNSTVGMIGPSGHILPFTTYWGSNENTVKALSSRMGIVSEDILNFQFVAGTMFYITRKGLDVLLNLAIDDNDFEIEAGQVDGTFAHALERAFSLSVYANGLRVFDTDATDQTFVGDTQSKYQFAVGKHPAKARSSVSVQPPHLS